MERPACVPSRSQLRKRLTVIAPMSSTTRLRLSRERYELGPARSGMLGDMHGFGPAPPRIWISQDSLQAAIDAASRWLQPPGFLYAGMEAGLEACFELGLSGVSLPMQRLFADCSREAGHDGPVLLQGEGGCGQHLAARAIAGLRGGSGLEVRASPEGLGLPSPKAIAKAELPWLLIPGMDSATQAEQEIIAELLVIAAKSGTKVITIAERPIHELQASSDAGSLGPYAPALLSSSLHGPALRHTPEDLPLLIHHLVCRYNRGDFGPPSSPRVAKVSTEWLYYCAAGRWPGNRTELERRVISASHKALNGNLRVFSPETRGTVQATWPSDCPFGLSPAQFHKVVGENPSLGRPVPLEDLPSFDLRSLMEEVDSVAGPGEADAWALEVRSSDLAEPRVSIGEGFTSMTVDGKRYPEEGEYFTQEQATVLEYLYRRFLEGDREVSKARVQADLHRMSSDLRGLFRSREGVWGEDGLLTGGRRGNVVLRIPDST